MKPIKRLLVANRGEIAIRVFRAATELKMRTIAVYTYEDRYSLHRYKADEAYQIGPDSEPLKPYLDVEEVVQLALRVNADAIHPGYGFMSENVHFARRCREVGITFVGPDPEIMEQLGDKIAAKAIARAAGVPYITDTPSLTSLEQAQSAAEAMGYPVMVKAAAGGGGRGMRVVRTPDQLANLFEDARSEAQKAFGDSTVFLEKFIDNPKHIEVQLLGDRHGNLVHLFERDCSVQRRFQKVVEVAPCATISQATREQLYQYALSIGRQVGYNNAGTVEFLLDADEKIYFIEVNPRIQVEHTITEEITGIDLVRAQLLIACGLPLNHAQLGINNQASLSTSGYAIQCRITTEDPENGFKPDFGTLIAYRHAAGMGIRLDEGSSYPGVQISPFFDSMLVKVSASGHSLESACARLLRTLDEFRIRGVKTNIPFLKNVISHPVFQAGKQTVNFIQNHPELLQINRTQDRGTKMLAYLAHTVVNGNPDVKWVDPHKTFRVPRVPEYDRYGAWPKGTKDRLNELGPDAFAQWMKAHPQILYTDTTLRDAHQSLLATRLRTADMLAMAESFAKNHPEVFSVEVWGGATFDVALRFLHEDPWQRLRLLRQAMPNMLLQMLFRSSNAVGYKAYPDNLVEQFIETAAANSMDVFRIFDSLNWTEALRVSTQAVRERTNSLAQVCICYTGDILNPERTKYNLDYYLDLARQIEDMGAHILCIKDMAGLLKPYAAEVLITELKKVVDLPIQLHTHDTSGIQSATYLKAVEAGVDAIDVALSSMSGLTSQPNFNSLVAMLDGQPRHCPINLPRLNQFSNYFEDVREYYYPFESELKAGTAQVYEHEIPGGQYSNLRPQARGLGIEDQFEVIKHNYKLANELFGDIVKVTPSSKVVGDMALFMTTNGLTPADVLAKGGSISFPDSVIELFRGDLGQPPHGWPAELQKLVLKDQQPFTDRPNVHLKPVDFDRALTDFRQKYGEGLGMEDLLSYLLYPKVYDQYHTFLEQYGEVSLLPTPAFFYGMKENEEIMVQLAPGKQLLIQYLNQSAPDASGMRTVAFKLNGQERTLKVRDESQKVTAPVARKVSHPHEIGAPLQGKLVKVLVTAGQAVTPNTPLFIIEAMKMESTLCAPYAGTVTEIELTDGTMVGQDDMVLRLVP